MSKNTGGPAFPAVERLVRDMRNNFDADISGGMTLRDYFAAKAMAPMVQNRMVGSSQYGNEVEIAARAYEIADAMIAERAK